MYTIEMLLKLNDMKYIGNLTETADEIFKFCCNMEPGDVQAKVKWEVYKVLFHNDVACDWVELYAHGCDLKAAQAVTKNIDDPDAKWFCRDPKAEVMELRNLDYVTLANLIDRLVDIIRGEHLKRNGNNSSRGIKND